MRLDRLKAGDRCVVKSVGGQGEIRIRLLDMGIIPGTNIEIVKFAPMGDPVQIRLRGYELTLRNSECADIEVELI